MHAINVQILTALGRSDLFLRIEVLKKIIGITPIFLGIFIGIKAMIIGMILTSVIALYINTVYTNRLIKLGLFEQLKSLGNSFFISIILISVLYPAVYYLSETINNTIILLGAAIIAILIIILISILVRAEEYYEIRDILMQRKKQYAT